MAIPEGSSRSWISDDAHASQFIPFIFIEAKSVLRKLICKMWRPGSRRRFASGRYVSVESLEFRVLLSVSADEQYFVYRLNRARHDPVAYAAEAGLPVSLNGTPSRPPLAVNSNLFDSSGFKSNELAVNNYFGHRSAVTGLWPNKLLRDNGYPLDPAFSDNSNQVESLAGGQNGVEAAMDGLIIDAGVPSLGHRKHLLSIDSFNASDREIGVGYSFNSASTYRHYWSIHITRSAPSDRFLTGVIYSDANGNQRYDRNEGLGGVTVSNGITNTTTNSQGGWSLKVAPGEYIVTATGGTFSGTSAIPVAVAADSVELDFISGLSTGYVDFDLWQNTAPVLDITPATTLLPVVRDNNNPTPNLAADLIVGRITDPDPAALTGLAVEALTGGGSWEYSTNGGANWNSFGTVSPLNARLLGPSDLIRFVPNAGFTGPAVLSYRAWDQTSGRLGSTANVTDHGGTTAFSTAVESATLTVIDRNTAPVLNTGNSPTMTDVVEDSTTHAGDSVASIVGNSIVDPDPGSVGGISVVEVTGDSHGTWQYSLDLGATWSEISDVRTDSGRLLRPLDRIRYVPHPDFAGTATILYHAWDQMSGTAGQLADLSRGTGGATSFSSATESASVTVTAVNDAPILDDTHDPKLTPVRPMTAFSSSGGNTVAELIGTAIDDVDVNALEGIAVIGRTGNGNWWFRNNGSWSGGTTSRSFAWLLKPTDKVQFTPDPGWTGTASIEFIAWDQTTGATHSGRWASVATAASVGGTTAYSLASDTATIFVGDAGTGPSVVSVTRADPSPTHTSRVHFTAVFSKSVTGVDPTDFHLVTTGDASGTISSVSGTGSTHTITVDGVTGNGTLALAFASSMNIKDAPGNLLNTSGFTQSEAYTVAPLRLAVALAGSTIQENDGDQALSGTVTRLNSDNSAALTVSLSSSDTTEATVPAAILIPAGQTSAAFDVAAVDDHTLDGRQTLTITASAADFESADVTLNVDDHETLTVAVSQTTVSEADGENAATLTVTRSNTDDPTAPQDLAVFSSDSTEAQVHTSGLSFSVRTVDDFLVDGNQTVVLTAVAAGFVSGQTTLIVSDDDVAGLTMVESNGGTVVSESGTTDTFTVVLDAEPTSSVVLKIASGDPGEAIVDLSVLTFTPANWNVAQTVTVTGVDDDRIDGQQTTTVTVSVDDTASDRVFDSVAAQTLFATTSDDDVAGLTIVESNGDTVVSESGTTDTFTVVLDAEPASSVVLEIASGDPGEAIVDLPVLTFTPANWNVAQTVTVTGVDDDRIDGQQTTTVTLSVDDAASDNDFDSVAALTLFVTTSDDDVAGFTIVESNGDTVVSESGTTDTFTVVLDAEPASSVVLEIASGDPGEAIVDLPVLTFTPANWNVAQTVTVTGVDDVEIDGEQVTEVTVKVRGGSGSNLPAFGNGLVELSNGNVFDPHTGLEWLDLRHTDNQSFDEVTERIASGDLNGWKFASSEQITQLLLNAGIPQATFGVYHGDNYEPAATLLSFWDEFVEPPPGEETNKWFLSSEFALDAGVARRRSGRLHLPPNRLGGVSAAAEFWDAWQAVPGLSSALVRVPAESSPFGSVPSQSVSVRTTDNDPVVTAGDVDADGDFDANDSFMTQLVLLAGTDSQIDLSKGSSSLSAAQIRTNIARLGTVADVDGDGDFDANDSFLIHLVSLAGTDAQIEQSKGSSPLTAGQIRTNVTNLGVRPAAASQTARASQVVRPVLAKDNDLFPTVESNDVPPPSLLAEATEDDITMKIWNGFRHWIDML